MIPATIWLFCIEEDEQKIVFEYRREFEFPFIPTRDILLEDGYEDFEIDYVAYDMINHRLNVYLVRLPYDLYDPAVMEKEGWTVEADNRIEYGISCTNI